MLKKILVVLDGSSAARAAKKYALKMAKKLNAELTGVGIIDTPWITAAQPEPLGGAAFKIHRDEEIIKQTHERIQSMLKTFTEECKKAEIKFSISELEGFPATEIEKMAEEHDLIIIGKTTDFHFDLDEDTDITVRHIVRDNPRPIIVVNSDKKIDGNVVIAYDGGLQSARALHMFLLLGLGMDSKAHILSVAKNQKEADQIAHSAKMMCESHGMKAEAEGIASRKAPEDVLKKKVQEYDAGLIVMGAYGHHGLKELIFGTTTEHLLKESESALFIHH